MNAYRDFLMSLIEELVIVADGDHASMEWDVAMYLSDVLGETYSYREWLDGAHYSAVAR